MGKILVVDDERMICDFLQAIFSQRGHEVHATTSPREAVELYRQHRPAVTLLDLQMPMMDGIAVLSQIRAVDPKAAVIMLTGVGTDDLAIRARDKGVTGFLRKGLPLDALFGATDRFLSKPEALPAVPKPDGHPAASANGSQDEATILIVDDEPMIRNMLTKFFTLRGYRVRMAQHGAEALAMVEQQQPDLVILDMYMPSMNGLEVLRELRARRYAGGVVALTASQDEHLLQQVLNLGSVDVIGKPVNLAQLELVVQVALVTTSSEPQVSRPGPLRA